MDKMITLRFLVLYKGSSTVHEHTREVPDGFAHAYITGYMNNTGGLSFQRWVLLNPRPEDEAEMRAEAKKVADRTLVPGPTVQELFAEAYGDK